MKTGDVLRDPQGRAFQLGQVLGRGLWGRVFAAREEGTGADWAVKVGLSAADLPEGGERLARVCDEILFEQGRQLQARAGQGLISAEALFRTADGQGVLVMPRYPSSLERRLVAGGTLEEVLRALVEVTRRLGTLGNHGMLRPTNVLLTDRGELRLSDMVTPTLARNLAALRAATGQPGPWHAPELRAATESPPFSPAADSYAIAMMLFRAAVADPNGGPPPPLPESGLDKAALVMVKDRVHNRLKAEPSNPRFHNRLSDRVAALLNRALSREVSPSPPYRFARLDELGQRLDEVLALVHPAVNHVGKLILERSPGGDTFSTDETVRFSVTIGATPGVETHEEIATGLAVFDQDRDERLRNVQSAYTVDRHPSGRFRFGFQVTDLLPGNYRVRVAFTIRDSGHEPITAEGRFLIKAAPGYVPPRVEPELQPLRLERPTPTAVTDRRPMPVAPTAPPEPVAPVERPAPVERAAPVERPAPVERVQPVAPPRPVEPPRLAPPQPLPPATPSAPVSSTLTPPETDERTAETAMTSPPRIGPAPRPASAFTAPVAVDLPAIDEESEDEDDLPEEPEYRGAGRWTDLPVPGMDGPDDDDDDALDPEGAYDPERPSDRLVGDSAPLTDPLRRLVELVQGEAYWLYVGGAVLLIVVLLIALLVLR